MALLEEWILPVEIDKKLQRSIERFAEQVLPEGLEWGASSLHDAVTFVAHVPVDELEELALELDEPLEHFEGWEDWRDEIDEIEGEAYELRLECKKKFPETFTSDEALPILSVSSKEGHNLAAWPAAFVLTARLAHELGATEPDADEE